MRYAGIGARAFDGNARKRVSAIAVYLAQRGWELHTGGPRESISGSATTRCTVMAKS
jgi:hypothetical protein